MISAQSYHATQEGYLQQRSISKGEAAGPIEALLDECCRRTHSNETAEAEVLLDDDVWFRRQHPAPSRHRHGNLPFTAAMTKRICVVSVAHVKCV